MASLEMVEDINFEKEIVKKTKYKYNKIAIDYMDYKDWNQFGRRRKTCFICSKKFKDGDQLSLLFDGNKLNTICCSECAAFITK
jgi:hypothetical protein